MTSRSPTSLPAFLMATASGLLSRPLMTMGEAVMSRVRAMNGVFVPLPAPGAPPSQMNSRGKRRRSRPYFSSRSSQTAEKMSLASFASSPGSGRGTGMPGLESPGFGCGKGWPIRAPERADGANLGIVAGAARSARLARRGCPISPFQLHQTPARRLTDEPMPRPLSSRLATSLLVVAVGAGLNLPLLGSADLWDMDEGLNAEAARQMAATGDWI